MLVLVACGSDAVVATAPDAGATETCIDRASVACACTNGSTGAQVCQDGGLGSCVCDGPSVDAESDAGPTLDAGDAETDVGVDASEDAGKVGFGERCIPGPPNGNGNCVPASGTVYNTCWTDHTTEGPVDMFQRCTFGCTGTGVSGDQDSDRDNLCESLGGVCEPPQGGAQLPVCLLN